MDTRLTPAGHSTDGEVATAEERTGQLAIRLIESALLTESHVAPATPPRRGRARRVEREGTSQRRVRILARSLYRDMRAQGFVTGEIVSVASALLGELISDFEDARELRRGAPVAGDADHDL